MVRRKFLFLIIFFPLLAINCGIDLLGLFNSTYLDERLRERNNFIFLTDHERNPVLGENYSFIVIADTHLEKNNSFGLENLQSVISDTGAAFAVFLGDITNNGEEGAIDNFIAISKSLTIPVYPVIGNHDIYFGNFSVWKNKIGPTSYRIEGDTATLLFLDSANSYFGKEQLDWLEKELIATKRNVFVFTHVNVFANKLKDVEQLSNTNERARLVSILNNKCNIMFSGHMHDKEVNKAGNVIFYNVESYIDYRSYCLVTVKGSEISYEVLKLTPY